MSPSMTVTGATGFIGRHLCTAAANGGVHVRRVGRRAAPAVDVACDLKGTDDCSAAVAGADFVVHLAAAVHVQGEASMDRFWDVNVEGTTRLAEAAAQAGVSRFLFMSTAGIAGTARSTVINERSSLDPTTPYAASKQAAEQRLLDIASTSGMDVLILRAPLVYGPGAPGNPARLRRYVQKRLPLPLGLAHNRRSAVAVGNLVDAINTALTTHEAANAPLYIEDGTVWSSRDMAVAVGRTIGRPPILVPVPPRLAVRALRSMKRQRLADQLFGSLEIDGSQFRFATGWEPPLSPVEALDIGVV